MTPPLAKIAPKELGHHGDLRVDPYFWLRNRDDPDTIAYLEAENRHTEEVMRPAVGLQAKLYDEILGRIQETDESAPVKRDQFFYFSRTEQGKSYPIYCRKQGSLDAPEEVLLDGNVLAASHQYFRLGNFAVSHNHALLAYSTDVEGDEIHTTYVKDLRTGELLPDRVGNTYYSLEWTRDDRAFFYTVLDEAKRPYQVWLHALGAERDELIYQENDARFFASLSKSRSGEYIFIDLHSPLTSEVRYLGSAELADGFRVLLKREQGIEYDAAHHGDFFYIRTNEQAPAFRVMRTPVSGPGRDNWEEVIPHRERVTVEGLDSFARHMVVYERDQGLERIQIRPDGGEPHYISFPEPVYSVAPAGNAEYETSLLRFTYSSLVTPASVYDYGMETRERTLKKRYEVRGGYDPEQYRSERVFAKAPDGVDVPVSLVYRAGMQRDGRGHMLLYGYGSYGISLDAAFSSDRLSLLDRGFIFGIAHVRGGADLGKAWHDAGKLAAKRNTFSDFIAAAEFVIRESYTAPDRLAIMGGSAGGLLMGAVVNERPELFRAVVAKVPFVDTLTTGLDPTLPLTVSEYEEWGNPTESPEVYAYIKSYSPYDNVRRQAYPAMLITAGLNDPRVSYWEPAKWVAKLRAMKTDSNILLLKTNMGSGHFGASGRYARIDETAFDYAFLLHAMGAGEPEQQV